MSEPFDPRPVMRRLKDFQRRTVDYVFRRLYLDDPPARRFLVADEVGLGKTMVARGLIARTLEHLHGKTERVDIVYVCSNAAIAAQNINRINVVDDREFALATRLTLLPTQIHGLASRNINFVSFTPGTTFEMKSHSGVVRERVVLYRMLHNEPWLRGTGLKNTLQSGVGKSRWEEHIRDRDLRIDPELAEAFRAAVRADAALVQRVAEVCENFKRYRMYPPPGDRELRNEVTGELRLRLAQVRLNSLEPDLVILDEFQRFRDLLDGQTDAAQLARDLFNYPDVRVLLLSATPYKMLSLDHEQDDDHYPDFLRTLRFLFGDEDEVAAVKHDIQHFRRALYSLADGDEGEVAAARGAVQDRLLEVMCRTERVSMTEQRDAMLAEQPRLAALQPGDLGQAVLVDRAARAVGAHDPIEYWKSGCYVLNFTRHYELRRKLDALSDQPSDDLLSTLLAGPSHLLTASQIEDYSPISPANARLRMLFADTLDRGMWKLLWLPPCLPYTAPRGAFAEVGDCTKALVFSAWNFVPDALATLCSYEAERRMLADLERDWAYSELYDRVRPLLRFTRGRDDRLTGMPTLALLQPSPTLAQVVDPLAIALEVGAGQPVTAEIQLERAEDAMARLLHNLIDDVSDVGPVDQRWYWAAPAILDARSYPAVRYWAVARDGWGAIGAGHEDDPESGFRDHVTQLVEAMDGKLTLGRPPEDLARVLAELALAGPGTCALRALRRVAPDLPPDHPALLSAAARVAGGFRTLFNLPETIALLRGGTREDVYWRSVLRQGIDGNIQSLLDEQVHVLLESLGVADKPGEKRVNEIGAAIAEALSIRTAQLRIDELVPDAQQQRIDTGQFAMRCRFALRFSDLHDDRDSTVARADTVRVAFNSPFRPYILASTSIGQEGLDFHTWCHAVVHWNLPSNPVDLEQREGRVQRYKGHAVRKNVARRFGLSALVQGWDRAGDPWAHLFERAASTRPQGASELSPFWVYEIDGGAKVERRVPTLPYSREVQHLDNLKRGLALYRLVFGQPRQEDLLNYLMTQMPPEDAHRAVSAWRISLAP